MLQTPTMFIQHKLKYKHHYQCQQAPPLFYKLLNIVTFKLKIYFPLQQNLLNVTPLKVTVSYIPRNGLKITHINKVWKIYLSAIILNLALFIISFNQQFNNLTMTCICHDYIIIINRKQIINSSLLHFLNLSFLLAFISYHFMSYLFTSFHEQLKYIPQCKWKHGTSLQIEFDVDSIKYLSPHEIRRNLTTDRTIKRRLSSSRLVA